MAGLLVFVDESGIPHPRDNNPVSALVAVCMRESSYFDLTSRLNATKRRYGWFRRVLAREFHATDSASPGAYERRNRKGESDWRVYSAMVRQIQSADLVVFAVIMLRPARPPVIPDGMISSEYYFLLQRVNSLGIAWREQATVLFDETGRGKDRKRAAGFSNLVHTYQDGLYFNRIMPVPYFGDSAISAGLEFADLCAYTIRQDESRRAASPPLLSGYQRKIKEHRDTIYAKTMDFKDFSTTDQYRVLRGVYRMPEHYFYRWSP